MQLLQLRGLAFGETRRLARKASVWMTRAFVMALSALLAHHHLGKPSLLLFLDAVKGVAGGDKTRLLIEVAAMLPDDEELREAYVDVAETISSSGNYRRAMKALK